jgi:glycosyltransferase involved in cell wall biosynthesis
MNDNNVNVSIIVPVFNEETYIRRCLDSIVNNDYPKENLEILIFDGGSTDNTLSILKEYEAEYPFIDVQSNPERVQVNALNKAIHIANGEFIIRCDAHSEYPANYVSSLVNYLKNSSDDVGNVGGQSIAVPGSDTVSAMAISIVMKHPFGVGLSHRSIQSSDVLETDTILFGAWKREIFSKVGYFDEDFIRGQDYEHNLRLIKKGFKVLLLPGLAFNLFTRTRLLQLVKMVYQYAYAKVLIIKKHGRLNNTRFLVPVAFVGIVFLSVFLKEARYMLYLYLLVDLFYSLNESIKAKNIFLFFVLYVTFPLMLLSYAFGVIKGFINIFLFGEKKKQWNITR